MIYRTTLDNIPKLVSKLAYTLKGGEVLALIGSLGAGKTTFTKHLAKELGVKKTVQSPTFTLHHIFKALPPLSKQKVTLHHLDIYRLKDFKEVQSLGIEEFWQNTDSITVIEWADKIQNKLPKNTHYIYFK